MADSPFLHLAESMYSQSPGGAGVDRLRQEMNARLLEAQFALPIELERKREEAKIQAGDWEAQYTAKQKAEIAQTQNGVERARKSGLFDEREMLEVERAAVMKIAGIDKQLLPKSAQQRQEEAWAADKKGIGMEWLDEWGNVKTREADGTIKTQVTFDKTQPGQEAKLQREREKDLAESRFKLIDATEKSDLGEPKRKYRDIEIQKILESMYPWHRDQNIQREAQERQAAMEQIVEQQQVIAQQEQEALQDWPIRAKKSGIDVKEVDLDLPPQIGMAQAYIRTMNDRYGGFDGVPKDKRTAYLEAYGILRQAQGQMRQQQQSAQAQEVMPSQRTWEPSAAPTPAFGF